MRPIALVGLGLLGVSYSAVCGQTARAGEDLTVCDLLRDREWYSGDSVAVRGVVVGTKEGVWLAAGDDCKYELKTRGVVWPNCIWLAFPRNESPDPNDHADFKVDWLAVRRAERFIRERGFDPEKEQVEETFLGQFLTYFDLDKRVNPAPVPQRLGFGHSGDAPAQLLIQTVRNPVIRPIAAREENERKK